MPAVRDELAATLQETLRLQQRLMDDVRDEGVPVADLVAQVSVLERLDDRRDQLISQLRRTASAGMRPARTSPPVREILLETLAHFRWPQNAGFLEEYLLARHQLQVRAHAVRLGGGSCSQCSTGPASCQPMGLNTGNGLYVKLRNAASQAAVRSLLMACSSQREQPSW